MNNNQYASNRTPGTSYPEQLIYWSIKQLFPDAVNRGKVLKEKYKPSGIEFDIAVPSKRTVIEYNSTYWHSDYSIEKINRDELKKKICEEYNVRLIIIEDDAYNEKEIIYTNNFVRDNFNADSDKLLYVIDNILKSFGKSIALVDIALAKKNAYLYSHGKIEYDKSLAGKLPSLASELHPKLNNIKADELFPYSAIRLYWRCNVCGYGENGEWIASLSVRATHYTGCNRCGYNWYTENIKAAGVGGALVQGENDLATLFPSLVNEWNSKLNKMKPSQVYSESGRKVYWTCTKCGYGENGEWCTQVCRRTVKNTGCPKCGYDIINNKYKAKAGQSKVYTGVDDLATKIPQLIPEYNIELNNGVDPSTIRYSSNKKVYWVCTKCTYGKNGEWLQSPNSRYFNQSGCPSCRFNIFKGRKTNYVGVHNNLKSIAEEYPALAAEWHPTLNDYTANEVGPGSHKIVYWLCPKCGYGTNGEWSVEVRKRIHRPYACKLCGYKWQDESH